MRITKTPASLLLAFTLAASCTPAMDQQPSATQPVGSLLPVRIKAFPRDIENYAGYDGQTKCSRGTKRGVLAFKRLIDKKFPPPLWSSAKRACRKGSISEHYEGRAIDIGLNAKRYKERKHAKRIIRWLMKKDSRGNPHAIARRLGIMYIIWNGRMWRAYDGGQWKKYEGSNKHTDHIHISFSRAGGLAETSFWTGKVADVKSPWWW